MRPQRLLARRERDTRRVPAFAGVEAVGDRLLLMLGAAAEHRIEPQAQEGCDHGKDDDLVNHKNSVLLYPDKHPGCRSVPMLPEIGTNYK